jgi:hypothetical protein
MLFFLLKNFFKIYTIEINKYKKLDIVKFIYNYFPQLK